MDVANLLHILFPIAVVQLVAWAVPGPNHLTIISASVTSGRTAGLRAAMGVAAGALTWSLIAVSGIAIVFELYQRRDFLTLHTCAQSLIPIDVMTVGWSISAFHASQAASTIAV